MTVKGEVNLLFIRQLHRPQCSMLGSPFILYVSGFLLGMPARRGYAAGVGAIFLMMTR